MTAPGSDAGGRMVGRYAVHGEIAHGGMATVHVGRLLGPAGFSRTVAIKCLYPQLAKDPEFVAMFMDEARLASRIAHPNVVSIIDVVAVDGEILLVMDYVQGESLARVMRQAGGRVEPAIAVRIITDVLSGLHAAHEAKDEYGQGLGMVHRDVSPQNILLGVDGNACLIDFGVAKAAGRLHSTRDGSLKGKFAYMSPEQIRSERVDRRTDIYAASVVLWELLAGQRLFQQDSAAVMYQVLERVVQPPSELAAHYPTSELDDIVLRGLAKDQALRFETALEMADELEQAVTPATTRQLARWVTGVASDSLRKRASKVAEVEDADSALTRLRAPAPTASQEGPTPDASPIEGAPVARLEPAPEMSTPEAHTPEAHTPEQPDTDQATWPVVEPLAPAPPTAPGWKMPALAGAALVGVATIGAIAYTACGEDPETQTAGRPSPVVGTSPSSGATRPAAGPTTPAVTPATESREAVAAGAAGNDPGPPQVAGTDTAPAAAPAKSSTLWDRDKGKGYGF